MFYGAFAGFLAALVTGIGYILLQLVLLSRGASSETLGVGLFFVVGFVLLRLAEMKAIVDVTRRSELHWTFEEFARASSRRWRAVCVAAGAIGQCALFVYSPAFWTLAFLGTSLTSILAGEFLSSRGEVDRETHILQYEGTEIDLNLLTGVRRFRANHSTILWLSFARGRTTYSTPHLLVLPATTFEALSDAFDAGLAQEVASRSRG